MKKIICPKCKSEKIEEMLYGMLYFEANEAFGKEDSFYGGCYQDEEDKYNYICLNCGYQWK